MVRYGFEDATAMDSILPSDLSTDLGIHMETGTKSKVGVIGLATSSIERGDARRPIELDRPLDIQASLGRNLNYAAVAQLVARAATALRELGCRPGQTVVVMKSNNLDVCLLAIAIARIGAIPALLSPELSERDVSTMLHRLSPAHLIADASAEGHLRDEAVEASTIISVKDVASRISSTSAGRPIPVPALDPGTPQLITHTSGTTGVPKLVMQTSATLGAAVATNVRMARLMGMSGPIAASLPYAHVRTIVGLMAVLKLKLPALVLTDCEPATAEEALTRWQPEFVEALPSRLVEWEQGFEQPNLPFRGTRYFMSTFDALHPRTMQHLLNASERTMPLYFQVYGQSETGPVSVRPYTRRTAERSVGRCVGYPFPGYSRFRVVDEHGSRASVGESGRIQARTAGMTPGYIDEPRLHDRNLDGRWWDMGDIGFITRFRCLHLLDRAVDHVDARTSLLKIEDELLDRFRSAREIVLIPSPDHPPVPFVAVSSGGSIDEKHWESQVRDLPPMGPPRAISWRDIPKTATGKVRRHALASRLGEDYAHTRMGLGHDADVSRGADG